MQGSVGFPVLHAQREARDIARGGVGRGGGGGYRVCYKWLERNKKKKHVLLLAAHNSEAKKGRTVISRAGGGHYPGQCLESEAV